MTVILIEPHLDDAVLFASYTILGENPIVATALGDTPDGERRIAEHREALDVVGLVASDVWIFMESERRPNWERVREQFELLRELKPETVYTPAPEVDGHEQHNAVTQIAEQVFGDIEILYYMTYVRGGRRSRGSIEVEPEHRWPSLKFQAMSCYQSQIERLDTRPWFAADDALREWLA